MKVNALGSLLRKSTFFKLHAGDPIVSNFVAHLDILESAGSMNRAVNLGL